LRIIYKEITKSNSIIKAIGDVLSNAKDWDGFRKKRQKKANDANDDANNDDANNDDANNDDANSDDEESNN
jgi:hypothetical protein